MIYLFLMLFWNWKALHSLNLVFIFLLGLLSLYYTTFKTKTSDLICSCAEWNCCCTMNLTAWPIAVAVSCHEDTLDRTGGLERVDRMMVGAESLEDTKVLEHAFIFQPSKPISGLEWPSQSPDLNLWQELQMLTDLSAFNAMSKRLAPPIRLN